MTDQKDLDHESTIAGSAPDSVNDPRGFKYKIGEITDGFGKPVFDQAFVEICDADDPTALLGEITIDIDNAKKHATLIAAAPDLLDAASFMAANIGTVSHNQWMEAVSRLEAAIAKALRETS